MNYEKIILEVTHRCNLKCNVCYRDEVQDDLPLKEIAGIARKFKNIIFLVSGGEPTVREDLPQIVKMLTGRNEVILLTNGVKIADGNYLGLLKRSGLRNVCLSFNGFDDGIYQKINAEGLLHVKMQALGNLKRCKMNTMLSMLLARGINEGEIKKMFGYYLNNRDFIRELRIRSMSCVGRYIDGDTYSISEMLDLVSRELNIAKNDIMNETEFRKGVNNLLGRKVFLFGPCQINFCLKIRKNKPAPFGRFIGRNGNISTGSALQRLSLISKILELYGLRGVLLSALKFLSYRNVSFIYNKDLMKIGLRSWPETGKSINEDCQTGYFINGKITSFCEANIKMRK